VTGHALCAGQPRRPRLRRATPRRLQELRERC
jgi:hypothetical protein